MARRNKRAEEAAIARLKEPVPVSEVLPEVLEQNNLPQPGTPDWQEKLKPPTGPSGKFHEGPDHTIVANGNEMRVRFQKRFNPVHDRFEIKFSGKPGGNILKMIDEWTIRDRPDGFARTEDKLSYDSRTEIWSVQRSPYNWNAETERFRAFTKELERELLAWYGPTGPER